MEAPRSTPTLSPRLPVENNEAAETPCGGRRWAPTEIAMGHRQRQENGATSNTSRFRSVASPGAQSYGNGARVKITLAVASRFSNGAAGEGPSSGSCSRSASSFAGIISGVRLQSPQRAILVRSERVKSRRLERRVGSSQHAEWGFRTIIASRAGLTLTSSPHVSSPHSERRIVGVDMAWRPAASHVINGMFILTGQYAVGDHITVAGIT